MTALTGTGPSSSISKTGTRSNRAKKQLPGTGSSSLLPSDDDERKSLTVGRYQFRKDGAGWECREIIGKGIARKRSYLSHLSRTAYERMQSKCSTQEELQIKLIDWADRKREQKREV